MMKHAILAAASAMSLFLLQPQAEQKNPLTGNEGQQVESVASRYKADIESAGLEKGASEVLATLQLLQRQLETNSKDFGAIAGDVASINSRFAEHEQKLSDIVDTKISNGKFVSRTAMDEAIAEVKKVVEEAKTASTGDGDGSCNCAEKFVEIFQRLEALENATGLTRTMYGGVSSTTLKSGGSSGSYVQTSYQSMQTMNAPVMSGGCTGGYVQNAYSAPPVDTRTVRVVEPRQPRRVTEVEVPVMDTSVQFSQSMPAMQTCTAVDPITGQCLDSVPVYPQNVTTSQEVTSDKRGFLRGGLLQRLRGN